MTAYPWPGNVRELENVIERAVVIDPGPVIRAGLLPFCGEVPPPAPAGVEDSAEGPLTLLQAERSHIVRMLERCGWNIAGTARVLGIDRTTLHKKINRYRIDAHPRKGAS
jgi:DNA-binding NtrC family response regulator